MDNTESPKVKGNLLIVEDDLSARQTLEAFLTREGYEVRCAPNGQTALMFAREDPPELILLDIRLPDMDGFEVCQRLKEHRIDNIPVIFISALQELKDKVRGFAAGGVDYVTKPFQAEELLARVETHLTLKRLQKQIEAQNAQLQRAHDELEERIKERTIDLATANEQLVASEKALGERLKFERMVSDLSARFVNTSPDHVDREIEHALQGIVDFFRASGCILIQGERGGTAARISHAVVAPGVSPLPLVGANMISLFPWASKVLPRGEVVRVTTLDDLPAEAAVDKESYRKWGVRSVLAIPITFGGSVSHSISLSSRREERMWPEEYISRLRMLGEILVSALKRKQTEEQLRERLGEIEELKLRLEKENVYLQEEVKLLGEHSEVVGQSLVMKKILAQVEQVAQTDSTVLILGETGTGKELLARSIHKMSRRKDRPLVTVNCASLPPTLIESELFGREKGAYTGALTKMVGRFEIADGSTLFLDEIGEIPLELQSKLLRVLEEGNFERLGSTKTLHVDVRIIAATNRDIAQEVQAGRFRKDLFYRLNVFPIVIPPLRERPDDIPLMVWAFVKEFQKKMGKEIENISKRAMESLQSYSWPGNVRELKNVLEHAMIVSSNRTLTIQAPKLMSSETSDAGSLADRNLEDMERRHIVSVLEKNGWRVGGKGGAAEVLGLKRSTLYSKMKKLGINRPSS